MTVPSIRPKFQAGQSHRWRRRCPGRINPAGWKLQAAGADRPGGLGVSDGSLRHAPRPRRNRWTSSAGTGTGFEPAAAAGRSSHMVRWSANTMKGAEFASRRAPARRGVTTAEQISCDNQGPGHYHARHRPDQTDAGIGPAVHPSDKSRLPGGPELALRVDGYGGAFAGQGRYHDELGPA